MEARSRLNVTSYRTSAIGVDTVSPVRGNVCALVGLNAIGPAMMDSAAKHILRGRRQSVP